MNVLVVSKTTNLELHGESARKRIASGLLNPDHLARLQQGHDEHYRCEEAVLKGLAAHRIRTSEVGRGHYWPDLSSYAAIITIGGDGTMLEASHHIGDASLPLIGIRSSTLSVGHLCAGGFEAVDTIIRSFVEGRLLTAKVQRLRAEIRYIMTGGSVLTDPVLNDFLYANSSPAATSRYVIRVGNHEEDQRSSGIWFATPAGSTAAIKAAGGKEVPLTGSDFQYHVREPYQTEPLSLLGGLFDPDSEKLEIENRCISAILALDGQHGVIHLNLGDRITFERAPSLTLARGVANT